jgi:hypothetical protein
MTPAYCFFIIYSEKTTDDFERSNNALVGGCDTSMQKCGTPISKQTRHGAPLFCSYCVTRQLRPLSDLLVETLVV